METTLFTIVYDLRSTIRDRLRSSAIIWKPALEITPISERQGIVKAGFLMIADDRSCFHIIEDNRKRSQSRLLHTFMSVSKLPIVANNMVDVDGGGNFAASKFISSFSP